MNETKNIVRSKTFWINLIMLLSPLVPAVDGMLKNNPQILVGVFAVVNIILRFFTKDQVTIN